jgi:hypothetical protein
VQDVTGDHIAANESWQQARRELEPFLQEQPENHILLGDLALTAMSLGDKAAAFDFSERAMAALSMEKDAVRGPAPIEILARVAAKLGEPIARSKLCRDFYLFLIPVHLVLAHH